MCTEAGTEAHSIVDNTPAENRLEAWRGIAQRFDPMYAHANQMSKSLKPPKGKIEHLCFSSKRWEEMVRRQDESSGRQARTAGSKWAIMADICPVALERHLVLNPDR